MKTIFSCLLLSSAAVFPISCMSQAQHASANGIPVEPIRSAAYQGWENALTLDNDVVSIVVVPSIGRIAHMSLSGEDNLLNLNAGLDGRVPPEEGEGWQNYGGDWIWPVSQERWKAVTGSDWPPPTFMNDYPGTARAWRNNDDSLHAVLERSYPAPLHITVTRTLHLPPRSRRFTINQRIERTGPSTIPVCLWQISQVRKPDASLLPTDPTSAFTNGFLNMRTPPADGIIELNHGIVTADTANGGEFKLGTDSRRGWIAARAQSTLLVQRATHTPADGTPYPDGGCTTELYSNQGLGYAEIESLSAEVQLLPGEVLKNQLEVSIHPIPDSLPDGLAPFAAQAAGETQPEIAPLPALENAG